MELATVHIDLPGGATAEVYKDLLRKTARRHEAELRKYMAPKADSPTKVLQSELEASNPAKFAIDWEVDLLALDEHQDEINAIYILNQVAEWSLGAVDAATMEMMTDAQYKALVQELDKLYKASPLAKGG